MFFLQLQTTEYTVSALPEDNWNILVYVGLFAQCYWWHWASRVGRTPRVRTSMPHVLTVYASVNRATCDQRPTTFAVST
jgi:hypothetical protein